MFYITLMISTCVKNSKEERWCCNFDAKKQCGNVSDIWENSLYMPTRISNDIREEYPLLITELYILITYNMTVPSKTVVDNIRKVGTFGGNCAGL